MTQASTQKVKHNVRTVDVNWRRCRAVSRGTFTIMFNINRWVTAVCSTVFTPEKIESFIYQET